MVCLSLADGRLTAALVRDGVAIMIDMACLIGRQKTAGAFERVDAGDPDGTCYPSPLIYVGIE